MTKTYLATTLATFCLISTQAMAGEYSAAINTCNTELNAMYNEDGTGRVKFREARSRGAGKAELLYYVWSDQAAGKETKQLVKCHAKKSTGAIFAINMKSRDGQTWIASR